MTVKPPRFDWSISFGNALSVLATLSAIGGVLWTQSAWQANTQRQMTDATKRADIWIPRIEALEKANTIQDERLSRLSDAVVEMRKANAEALRDINNNNAQLVSTLSVMREDIASIKATLNLRPLHR